MDEKDIVFKESMYNEITLLYKTDNGYSVRMVNPFDIEKVIFNDPATVVMWADGTKTVVKCDEEDIYDEQTGLLMCIAKKAFGNKGKFNDILREWVPEPGTVCMGDVIDHILGDFIKKGTYVFGGNNNA